MLFSVSITIFICRYVRLSNIKYILHRHRGFKPFYPGNSRMLISQHLPLHSEWPQIIWLPNCHVFINNPHLQNETRTESNLESLFFVVPNIVFHIMLVSTLWLPHTTVKYIYFIATTKHIYILTIAWLLLATILCKFPCNYVSIRQSTWLKRLVTSFGVYSPFSVNMSTR